MASAAEQLAANLNFAALAKAEELKKRIWFTLGALLVYRFGTYIPAARHRSLRLGADFPKRRPAAFSACSTCSPVVASTGWRSSPEHHARTSRPRSSFS
jgi:preprotein translocase subunit SecY